jgi:hypothetical protein
LGSEEDERVQGRQEAIFGRRLLFFFIGTQSTLLPIQFAAPQ